MSEENVEASAAEVRPQSVLEENGAAQAEIEGPSAVVATDEESAKTVETSKATTGEQAASAPGTAVAPSDQSKADTAQATARSAADVIERAKAALSETRVAGSGPRDVPISTIVHLLGISTANQVSVLESKLDILTTKITTASYKIDRLAAQIDGMQSGALLDRIDFQLSDIKSILKKVLPHAMTTVVEDSKSKSKAKVISSAPAATAKPADADMPAETDNDEQSGEAETEYQRSEGQRVRDEMAGK